jgi:hypothetical protein
VTEKDERLRRATVRKVETRSKEKSPTSSVLQPPPVTTTISGLRDNYSRGKVGEFLRQKIQSGSTLSVVSAYFTIYAFEALKAQLNSIASLRFLFGEPRFLKSLDPERTDKKAFKIEDDGLQLANRLEQAPFGLYAVVPPQSDYQQIVPGVIFCLKQLGDTTGNETVNPLQPYFLVYVRNDGIVRYTFAQPKQILEIYRVLCVGKTVPYEALCNLFDEETQDGSDMILYSELLQKAVESIVHTFKKRALTGLLSGRGGVLVEANKQVTSTSDFQLITWLVIK